MEPRAIRSQDEKLDEALKGTFPASDPFYLLPERATHNPSVQGELGMAATDTSALARHLFETRGAAAIAEAARKAASFREAGDVEQAKVWQGVESVLREMRGPRQS